MKETILLLCMLFCHIVDDYYLQGWLASAKQKSWWEKITQIHCIRMIISWLYLNMLSVGRL